MPRMDKRIEVQASPERVFEVLRYLELMPRWKPDEVRATWLGRLREARGALVQFETLVMGTPLTCDARIEHWQPARRIAWRQVEGDWAAHEGVWDLAPLPGNRTLVRLRADVRLPHAMEEHLLAAEAERDVSRAWDAALFGLKEMLEEPLLHRAGGVPVGVGVPASTGPAWREPAAGGVA